MRLLLSIFLLAASCFSQSRDDAWRQDLDTLANQIKTKHISPYHATPQSVFDAAVARLRDQIPSRKDHEIVVEMARITALVGDAHTSLSLTQSATGFHVFPIRLQWFDDGLFVTQAGTTYGSLIGKKVLKIQDLPVDDAQAAISGVISHENDVWTKVVGPGYMITAEVLNAVGIIPTLDEMRITVEQPGGDPVTQTISIQPQAVIGRHLSRPLNPLYQRNSSLQYWFDYIPEAATLYIKYNQCQESVLLSMADFSKQLVAYFQQVKVDRIVIDLRNNSGGNSAILHTLVGDLQNAYRQGTPLPANGAFVIIGKVTFSSGMLNAIELKQSGLVLVGEPTGGKPSGYGEVAAASLPNSKLLIGYSTKLFPMAGYPDSVLSLNPDIAVVFNGADFFGDRDPYLAAVLAAVNQ